VQEKWEMACQLYIIIIEYDAKCFFNILQNAKFVSMILPFVCYNMKGFVKWTLLASWSSQNDSTCAYIYICLFKYKVDKTQFDSITDAKWCAIWLCTFLWQKETWITVRSQIKSLVSFHFVDFVMWDGIKLTGCLLQYFALRCVSQWTLYLSIHSGGYIMCAGTFFKIFKSSLHSLLAIAHFLVLM
jgi:hypothetical protein